MKTNIRFVRLFWRPFLDLLRRLFQIIDARPEVHFDHMNITNINR
jgi:hypothetical protein